MYERIRVRVQGMSPLMLHNGDLANPMNSTAKAIKKISSKRKKVDADFEEMARLEYYGGLYLDREEHVIIPSHMLEACIVNGAKKHREGPAAKAGVIVPENARILYDGPQTPEGLWEDESFRDQRMVKVQTSKVLRTRPLFEEWGLEFDIEFNPDLVQPEMIKRWVETMGYECGLGDYRPKFGRFVATIV